MTDYQKHALLCAIAAALVWPLNWVIAQWGLPWGAFLAGTALAWGYEFLQKYRKEGEFSPKDALAGMAGAGAIAVLLFFVLRA
jgi:hypothetical protein